jgi:hypothetical protein
MISSAQHSMFEGHEDFQFSQALFWQVKKMQIIFLNLVLCIQNPQKSPIFGTVKREAFEHVKNLRFFTVANFQFANIGNRRFPKVRKYKVFSKIRRILKVFPRVKIFNFDNIFRTLKIRKIFKGHQ